MKGDANRISGNLISNLVPKSPNADGKTHAMELYLSDILPPGKNEFVYAITFIYVTKTQKYTWLYSILIIWPRIS